MLLDVHWELASGNPILYLFGANSVKWEGMLRSRLQFWKRDDHIGGYPICLLPGLNFVIYCRCGRESSYWKLEALQTLNISTSVMFLVMYSHASMFTITKMLLWTYYLKGSGRSRGRWIGTRKLEISRYCKWHVCAWWSGGILPNGWGWKSSLQVDHCKESFPAASCNAAYPKLRRDYWWMQGPWCFHTTIIQ